MRLAFSVAINVDAEFTVSSVSQALNRAADFVQVTVREGTDRDGNPVEVCQVKIKPTDEMSESICIISESTNVLASLSVSIPFCLSAPISVILV